MMTVDRAKKIVLRKYPLAKMYSMELNQCYVVRINPTDNFTHALPTKDAAWITAAEQILEDKEKGASS